MESSNTQAWQSMQKRIEGIQKRKELIPQINKLKKELLIIRMQVAKMEERALDNLYASKKLELRQKTEELKVLRAAYLQLADEELSVLNVNLEIIRKQRYDPTVYALDLEEHQGSLVKAIAQLKEEKDQIKHDTTNTAMARSHVKNDASDLDKPSAR